MATTTTGGPIRMVGTVFVPVSDQDRALEFYVEKLGFELRLDSPYDGASRWVEVAPPGGEIVLALVPQSEGTTARSDRALCALVATDIDATHLLLRSRGVDVDAEIAGPGVPRNGLMSLDAMVADPAPRQYCLRDPDGNRFLIV